MFGKQSRKELLLVTALGVILFSAACSKKDEGRGMLEDARTEAASAKKEDTPAEITAGDDAPKTHDTVQEQSTQTDPPVITEDRAREILIRIDEKMRNYIWVTILGMSEEDRMQVGSRIDIELTESERIRAAALAGDPDLRIDDMFVWDGGQLKHDSNAETGPLGDGCHGWSVTWDSVEKNCIDLFGVRSAPNSLQTTAKNPDYDVIQYSDQTGTYALVIDTEIDFEVAQLSQSYTVEAQDGFYNGIVDLYWGYWGILEASPDISNFRVTYTLVPDQVSVYGLAISAITIEKTADENTYWEYAGETDPEYGAEASAPQPFYGIWCSAGKDENDAQNAAEKLTAQGLQGEVFVSDSWSNLNRERWYVITAGVYATEEEANAMLDTVRNAGYPGAYVKYSGDYLE